MSTQPENSSPRIPALDGIRALTVLGVVWYHVWQQSWLTPLITFRFHNRTVMLSLDFIPRSGYLFVDMMLLLSAFCLFLPHARSMVLAFPVSNAGTFYRRRIARIVPSYYFCVLILFFYALAKHVYGTPGEAAADLIANLTFTQTLFPSTYMNSHINGVLWTAAIEMQFYLIFPLLARFFRKKPLLTYLCMVLVGSLYLRLFALGNPQTLRLTLNQLAGFFGVFANGMLAAYLYVLLSEKTAKLPRPFLSVFAFFMFFVSVYLLIRVQNGAVHYPEAVQVYQARYRFVLSLVFSLMLLSASLGGPAMNVMLGNPVLHFFSEISYNLYIWHQWIAVHLKTVHLPYWDGDVLPNMAGNTQWQHRYTWIVLIVSVAVAALITYSVEKPMRRLLLRQPEKARKES